VYQRYKRELLEPNLSQARSFGLLQELHASLQQHAELKKYFWKARESHRIVAKLQHRVVW
jgi:signal transduction histidine kinase